MEFSIRYGSLYLDKIINKIWWTNTEEYIDRLQNKCRCLYRKWDHNQ